MRGVRNTNVVTTGAGVTITLPNIDRTPAGIRLIVLNDPASTDNLTVTNDGVVNLQTFNVIPNTMTEFRLLRSEASFAMDQTHQGAGYSTLWTGRGFWLAVVVATTVGLG